MKKIYLLLFIVGFSFKGFSQCSPYPTNREVYDYAVGDTFQYYFSANSGYYQYHYKIVTNRIDYGNDSIAYTIKQITSDWNNHITTSTNPSIIYYIDSTITYRVGSTFDTVTCSTDSGILLYHITFYQSTGLYCDVIQQNIFGISSNYVRFSVGLGTTYSYLCSNTSPCNYCTSLSLIYAHKSNGYIYGHQHRSSFLSVEEIGNYNSVSISPNPTTTSFTVQLSTPPSPETYFQLYDAMGRQLRREEINSNTTTINRNNLTSGIYFWQLVSGNRMLERGKLVME